MLELWPGDDASGHICQVPARPPLFGTRVNKQFRDFGAAAECSPAGRGRVTRGEHYLRNGKGVDRGGGTWA